ncbi:MAG: hypothetical protein V1647_00370 [Pseudomonadota bacterium]
MKSFKRVFLTLVIFGFVFAANVYAQKTNTPVQDSVLQPLKGYILVGPSVSSENDSIKVTPAEAGYILAGYTLSSLGDTPTVRQESIDYWVGPDGGYTIVKRTTPGKLVDFYIIQDGVVKKLEY